MSKIQHREKHVTNIVVDLGPVLARIDRLEEKLMGLIEDFRAGLADNTLAIGDLGAVIVTETDQVAQLIADLVAAVGNQVTAADVAAILESTAKIRAAGVAVSGIAPDAVPDPGPTGPPEG